MIYTDNHFWSVISTAVELEVVKNQAVRGEIEAQSWADSNHNRKKVTFYRCVLLDGMPKRELLSNTEVLDCVWRRTRAGI